MASSTFESVRPLSSPVYTPLTDVGRCLHVDDVIETYEKKMMLSYGIRNTQTCFQNKKVLWVAPTTESDEHNFYGNVTFIVDWKSVFAKFGPHMYLVDQSILGKNSYTRILLTNRGPNGSSGNSLSSKPESNVKTLLDGIDADSSDLGYNFLDLFEGLLEKKKVDVHSTGSPIIEKDGQMHHVSEALCKGGRLGAHEVQIGIETWEDGGKWFYENCLVQANDHSHANCLLSMPVSRGGKAKIFQSYKCFKFNTASNAICPYQLSASASESLIKTTCPDLMSAFSRKSTGRSLTSSKIATLSDSSFSSASLKTSSTGLKFERLGAGSGISRPIGTISGLSSSGSEFGLPLAGRSILPTSLGGNRVAPTITSNPRPFSIGTGQTLAAATNPVNAVQNADQNKEPSLEEIRNKRLSFLSKLA